MPPVPRQFVEEQAEFSNWCIIKFIGCKFFPVIVVIEHTLRSRMAAISHVVSLNVVWIFNVNGFVTTTRTTTGRHCAELLSFWRSHSSMPLRSQCDAFVKVRQEPSKTLRNGKSKQNEQALHPAVENAQSWKWRF